LRSLSPVRPFLRPAYSAGRKGSFLSSVAVRKESTPRYQYTGMLAQLTRLTLAAYIQGLQGRQGRDAVRQPDKEPGSRPPKGDEGVETTRR
jgi:hypothetical protein